jgi:regulator of replication initiation timing
MSEFAGRLMNRVEKLTEENKRLERELDEADRRHTVNATQLATLAEQRRIELVEVRDAMTRLLRDGIANAPCPNQAQWRQLQDFAKGYLVGIATAQEVSR